MHERIVAGVFTNQNDAREAIEEFRKRFKPKDISVIMKDRDAARRLEKHAGKEAAKGAAGGAVGGAVIGGLAGFLIGAAVLPGGIIIAGPAAAYFASTGAATGAVTGGVLGSLTRAGLTVDIAKNYSTHIENGGVLVAMPIDMHSEDEARFVFEKHHATDMRIIRPELEGTFAWVYDEERSAEESM